MSDNDYFRYAANILPGGIARSQPITQTFDAIERAFALLPNPAGTDKRGFSQPLQVAPATQSNQAATLGQLMAALADYAELEVDLEVVQQAVEAAVAAAANAENANAAAQSVITYLLEHQATAPLLGLAIGAATIDESGDLLLTVKNPDDVIQVETISSGEQASAEVVGGPDGSHLLLRIPRGAPGDVDEQAVYAARLAAEQAAEEAESAATDAATTVITQHENKLDPHAQYVRKDTEALKKQATLDLDFAGGDYALDDGEKLRTTNAGEVLTVERATPKWVFGPNGKLREVPPNTLARQWNPETGEPEGVLIEESRTNLLLWSEDFSSDWLTARSTLTTNAALAPDGSNTAAQLSEMEASGDPYIYQNVTIAADSYYTLSIFAKAVPGASRSAIRVQLRSFYGFDDESLVDVNLLDGTVGVARGAYSITEVGGGYYRISVSAYNALGHSGNLIAFIIRTTDTPTSSFYIWGAQLEEGSTPSSYIPTEDAPVTRAEDNVSRELGSEYNPAEGTVLVECDVAGIKEVSEGFATAIASIGNPGRSGTLTLFTRNSAETPRGRISLLPYGDITGSQTTLVILDNVHEGVIKIAFSYQASTGVARLSAMGFSNTSVMDFSQHEPETPEFLLNKLGRVGESNYSTNKKYRAVYYIPRALSEQELVELTK